MTEHRAFLRAIISGPEDDLPRLIAADWLEEAGHTRLSEFIRKQIDPTNCVCMVPLSCIDPVIEHALGKQPHECRREASNRNCTVQGAGVTVVYRRGFVHEICVPTLAVLFGGPCNEFACEDGRILHGGHFRECHVCSGTGRTPGISAQLFAEHPVQVVRVGDREPFTVDETWRWSNQFLDLPSYLPDMIWRKSWGVTRYWSTREKALGALSTAICAHGRALAFPEPV